MSFSYSYYDAVYSSATSACMACVLEEKCGVQLEEVLEQKNAEISILNKYSIDLQVLGRHVG